MTGDTDGSGLTDGSGDTDGSGVVRRDRFSGGPARGFLSSLAADERIFAADLAVDRAHVVMLAEAGVVEEDTAGAILDALDDIEAAGHGALPDGEDVHEAIETAVVERVGPDGGAESSDSAARQSTQSSDGGRMHTARSRNDEVATCIRYRLREDLLAAVESTLDLRAALLSVAEDESGTVMPGFTHLQPAQPTTVAHWALSYEQAVARDTERLLAAYDRTNESPLGAAAFAGTTFDVDRERTAELLGFDAVLENSMDAAAARDFLLEATGALATHAVTLSGLAEDVVFFANRGFVDLSDAYSSTSSIMPQKKNPDTMELVRASAGDAAAGLQGLLTTLKGLPRAYNRDLQRATGHAWDTVDAVPEATDVAAGAVATADWPADALEAAAGEGFSTATGVADLLAAAGVPFRSAHEAVALAAEESTGTPGVATLDAAVRKVLGEPFTSYVSEDAVAAALDPVDSVASRDSRGGPAPDAVAEQVDAAAAGLDADRDAVTERGDQLVAAEDALEDAVRDY